MTDNKTNANNAPTVAISTVKSGGLATLGDALGASLRRVPASADATSTQGGKLADIATATAPPVVASEPPVVTRTTSTASSEADALKAELARLMQENADLKAKKHSSPGKLSLKISEKGVVCLYGLGRFPVSLYDGQWRKLMTPEVCAKVIEFLDANKDKLPSEEQTKAALAARKAAAAAANTAG